jgi:hypothetical protein
VLTEIVPFLFWIVVSEHILGNSQIRPIARLNIVFDGEVVWKDVIHDFQVCRWID